MGEREELEQAITALESQRGTLGDIAVDAALAGLRQKLRELHRLILPCPEPAPSVPSHGLPLALSGERKLVTVMFVDISGYTTLFETADPEAVRNLVNACFERLVPVVHRYGGTVARFMGDCILALFGAPVAHENDAERACRAALDILDTLAAFNVDQGSDLHLHLGVNTGLVIAGPVGTSELQEYSVTGDAANLAARLQAASETGQILVGPDTYRLTAALFEFESLPPMRPKGKAGFIAVYRLIARKARPGTRRGFAGPAAPLIGRDAEFARLEAAVQGLGGGKGSIVAVVGEPGLGKSRLVSELRRACATSGGAAGIRPLWAEGRGESHTEGISYRLARNVLDSVLGVRVDTSPADASAALRSTVEQLFPDHHKFAAVYHYLARLRDAPLDPESEAHLQPVVPEALQRRMRRAFADLIRALCRMQPIVLVWEDLHWSDASSLGVLETLLPVAYEARLLLLLVFRPCEGPAGEWWRRIGPAGERCNATVELSPLTRSDSRLLMRNLLQIDNMQEDVRELILNKAEGNPFYLEEMLRSLIDSGQVRAEGERTVAAAGSAVLSVPDTLQEVIAARIDRLPADDKRALQIASVIGPAFRHQVLACVLKREPIVSSLEGILEELQLRDLIRRRESEYVFKHAITQEVAYNGLLLARRRELHRLTAEALETLFQETLDDWAATLGYHYGRAGSGDKAVHYLTRAADRARETHSNDEAIALYRTALEQTDLPRQASLAAALWEDLGEVFQVIGDHDQARLEYEHALSHVPDADRLRRARLQRKIGVTHNSQRNLTSASESISLAEAALPDSAERSGEEWGEWLDIHRERLEIAYWMDEPRTMADLIRGAETALDQHGSLKQRAQWLHCRVMEAMRRERYAFSAETLLICRHLVDVCEQMSDPYEVGEAYFTLGSCLTWYGVLAEGEQRLLAGLARGKWSGNRSLRLRCLVYLAMNYRRQGQPETSEEYTMQVLHEAEEAGVAMYEGFARANLAWLAWRAGDLDETERLGHDAARLWNGGYMFEWVALWPLLAVAHAREDVGAVVERIRAMLAPSQQRLPDEIEAALKHGIEAWEGGDFQRTRQLVSEILKTAQRSGWL